MVPPEDDATTDTTDLADRIAFALEQDILTGVAAPGTRLGQQDICDRFGVSRTPVREALRKLQALHLVDLIPNRGATVRTPSSRAIEEIFDLRAELEGYAAELACRNADADFDAQLDRALSQINRVVATFGPDHASNARHNSNVSGRIRDFHGLILARAGNQQLTATVRELEAMYLGDFCGHMIARPDDQKVLQIDEHRGIRDAIVSRAPRAARELMRAHVLHAKHYFLTYFQANGGRHAHPHGHTEQDV